MFVGRYSHFVCVELIDPALMRRSQSVSVSNTRTQLMRGLIAGLCAPQGPPDSQITESDVSK